jgi:hypothetical protein
MRKRPRQFVVRDARRTTPPPADGNVYREIVRDRVAARFGQQALATVWSIGLPDTVMLDPAGPIHQAIDRVDELQRSAKLSKTAARDTFLALVNQWHQGYLGATFVVQERHRKTGRKVAAANRRRKAEIDADRAAWIVGMYRRIRGRLPAGHEDDVRARRSVADRWEAATGFPITDRTIRNILDAAGVKRHRRPRAAD